MKACLVLILICLPMLPKAQSQYTISFPDIDGQTINLTNYTGKNLLVLVCDAARPNAAQLTQIDSLYQANDSILSLIVLPINDLGTPPDDSVLSVYFKDSLHLHCTIGRTSTGSKTEDDQQPLLRWVTHVSDNAHFDNDVTQDGQMFLINETGILFGQFEKTTPVRLLSRIIKQTIIP